MAQRPDLTHTTYVEKYETLPKLSAPEPIDATVAQEAKRSQNYGITALAWLEFGLSSPPESTAVAT